MSVTYESAMSTLTGMFGSVDPEVVAMILQANNGHMEKTVENLLAMTSAEGEKPSTTQHRPPPQRNQPAPQQQGRAAQPMPYQPPQPHYYPPQQQPPPSYPPSSSPQGRRESMNEQKSGAPPPSSSAPSSSSSSSGANDVYKLSDDFLRPPSWYQAHVGPPPDVIAAASMPSQSGMSDADIQAQIDQDHLLAQMLNDQQFMEDLANNPELYASPADPSQPPASARSQRHAPPAHPHPDFSQHDRRGSNAASAPLAFNPSTGQPSTGQALASPLMSGGGSRKGSTAASTDQLPVSDKLRSLEQGSNAPAYSSGQSGITQQQSSFKRSWDQLTSAAREKLSRLSQKFKKDKEFGENGGDYQEMGSLNSLPRGSSSNSGSSTFLTAEEAASLQAGYNPPKARLIERDGSGFTLNDNVERDPFGKGANGSDDEDIDEQEREQRAIGRYLDQRPDVADVEMSAVMPSPNSSATPNRGDYSSASSSGPIRLNSIQPELVHLSPNQFKPLGFPSPSEINAAGRSNQQRNSINSGSASSGSGDVDPQRKTTIPTNWIDEPSDDESEKYVSPAAMAKRKAKKDKSVPLLQDM